jgi:uncharacterized membrane protein YkoI
MVGIMLCLAPCEQTALARSIDQQGIVLAGNEITLDQAVNKVRRETGGHILSARRHNGAEPIYIIKVLLRSGQVKVFRVNAQTGEIR